MLSRKELKKITKEVASTYNNYLNYKANEKPKEKTYYYEITDLNDNIIIDNTLCDTKDQAIRLQKQLKDKGFNNTKIITWTY